MILDHAYGEPSQAIQHSGSVGTYDLTKVTDEDLDRLEAILGPIVAEIRAEKARREANRERERVARDAEGIRARCQTLTGLVKEAWHVLEPRARYQHNWHIDAVADHLEAVTDGRINRLLINEPPGFMKSLMVSVFWQAGSGGRRGSGRSDI